MSLPEAVFEKGAQGGHLAGHGGAGVDEIERGDITPDMLSGDLLQVDFLVDTLKELADITGVAFNSMRRITALDCQPIGKSRQMGRIHKSGVESLFHPVYNKKFPAQHRNILSIDKWSVAPG